MVIIICSLSLIEKKPHGFTYYVMLNLLSIYDLLVFTFLNLIWNRKYCNITYMYKSSYDYCHFFHYKYITISLKWITYMETHSSRSTTPIFNCLKSLLQSVCTCTKYMYWAMIYPTWSTINMIISFANVYLLER